MKKMLVAFLVLGMAAGQIFAEDGLVLTGEFRTGVNITSDGTTNAGDLDPVVTVKETDAGNAPGRLRVNFAYTKGNLQFKWRLQIRQADAANGHFMAPNFSDFIPYIYGMGDFFDNQFRMTIGKLEGDAPWETSGDEIWGSIEGISGVRLEYKPAQVPGLNVGLLIPAVVANNNVDLAGDNLIKDKAKNGKDDVDTILATVAPKLAQYAQELRFGVRYDHDLFGVRVGFQLDGTADDADSELQKHAFAKAEQPKATPASYVTRWYEKEAYEKAEAAATAAGETFVPGKVGGANIYAVMKEADIKGTLGTTTTANYEDILKTGVIGTTNYDHSNNANISNYYEGTDGKKYFAMQNVFVPETAPTAAALLAAGEREQLLFHNQAGAKLIYRLDLKVLGSIVPGLSVWANGQFEGLPTVSGVPDWNVKSTNWLYVKYATGPLTAALRTGLYITSNHRISLDIRDVPAATPVVYITDTRNNYKAIGQLGQLTLKPVVTYKVFDWMDFQFAGYLKLNLLKDGDYRVGSDGFKGIKKTSITDAAEAKTTLDYSGKNIQANTGGSEPSMLEQIYIEPMLTFTLGSGASIATLYKGTINMANSIGSDLYFNGEPAANNGDMNMKHEFEIRFKYSF